MKKIIAMLLALVMMLALAACGNATTTETTAAAVETTTAAEETTTAAEETTTAAEETEPVEVPVMTHEEFMAAEMEAAVCVETYVQAHQSWWDNKVTVYCQSPDGAYFLYELACSEEDAAKLEPGTKIKVTGYKTAWEGEVEIVDGTFEFVEGDAFVAEATDVTGMTEEELLAHQNEKVLFKGLTVKKIEYKNGEPGDDIYVTVAMGETEMSFCVEMYLTGPDTDVYKAFADLAEGAVVDIEGFLYWYQGVNTHITAVTPAA